MIESAIGIKLRRRGAGVRYSEPEVPPCGRGGSRGPYGLYHPAGEESIETDLPFRPWQVRSKTGGCRLRASSSSPNPLAVSLPFSKEGSKLDPADVLISQSLLGLGLSTWTGATALNSHGLTPPGESNPPTPFADTTHSGMPRPEPASGASVPRAAHQWSGRTIRDP